jgi:hypothetical protein
MDKRPIAPATLRRVPQQCRWGDQRLVRERSLDQLSPPACALSLLLVTVAEAQGLRCSADRSRCQRLSMPHAGLHQARQALIQRGLVASQRPLSQVFARDAAPREAPPSAAPGAADDEPVDSKTVFARLWEVVR